MRIIGIRIHDGRGELFMSPVEVMRGVKDGWFPFGDYPEPKMVEGKWSISRDVREDGFFNVFSERPRIQVAAIVGKNGSGKSSLLDYLLMIINNAACCLLFDQYAKDEQPPVLAHGLYAELYFETDGIIRRVRCKNTDVFYSEGAQEIEINNLDQCFRYEIASKLFYLIMCNFGSYSLNANEFVSKTKLNGVVSKVNGDWLYSIFNQEQNYIFPVTITPRRNGGNIDVNQLKIESVEKLIALMLFAKSRGFEFMPGYQLSRFKYKYDETVRGSLRDKIGITARKKDVDTEGLMKMATSIIQGWIVHLGCGESYYSNPEDKRDRKSNELFRMLLDYIGYNTLLLCAQYDKFRSRFDVVQYVKEHRNLPYVQSFIREINEDHLFETIEQDHTNLTYGIRKCIKTVREALIVGIKNHPYLVERRSTKAEDLELSGTISLEEVLYLLPPPIFTQDVLLVKDAKVKGSELFSIENKDANEIQLSKLSSGEKQFLYSLSSTLFHIKSMDESIAFSKNISFHNLCLVFDEAELYFHPEYQQNFLFNLLRYLSWIRLGNILSIQIVIATHSPFILSDIPKESILFMRDGHDYRSSMKDDEAKEFNSFGTFGANYYDLLKNGFFIHEQPIGTFASFKIAALLETIKSGRADESVVQQVGMIADPIIKGYLLYEIKQAKDSRYVQD